MKLVYVFNYFESEGYLCRVPVFIACIICKFNGRLDYIEDLKDAEL